MTLSNEADTWDHSKHHATDHLNHAHHHPIQFRIDLEVQDICQWKHLRNPHKVLLLHVRKNNGNCNYRGNKKPEKQAHAKHRNPGNRHGQLFTVMQFLNLTLTLMLTFPVKTPLLRTICRQTNSWSVISRTSQLSETFDLQFAISTRYKF